MKWATTKSIIKENRILILVILLILSIAAVVLIKNVQRNNQPEKPLSNTGSSVHISSETPCIGAAAPNKWKHVVVLMFENRQWNQVIGSKKAPYITSLVAKCGTSYSGIKGTAPLTNWHDSNYKVDGSFESNYFSKPSYSVLTTGLSPEESGINNDLFDTKSYADNIYLELKKANITAKDYYDGPASSSPCTTSDFKGAYHDPIRYYAPTIGIDYCDSHDVPLTEFMKDVNSGNLPAFSMIIPTNCENMHACLSLSDTTARGDKWAKNFLTPILNSRQYQSGDTAIFFLWDEDTPIPNVLIAPSIISGSRVSNTSKYPVSHFSATRTWSEMLGIKPLGDSGRAPSLLYFFNGAVNN